MKRRSGKWWAGHLVACAVVVGAGFFTGQYLASCPSLGSFDPPESPQRPPWEARWNPNLDSGIGLASKPGLYTSEGGTWVPAGN